MKLKLFIHTGIAGGIFTLKLQSKKTAHLHEIIHMGVLFCYLEIVKLYINVAMRIFSAHPNMSPPEDVQCFYAMKMMLFSFVYANLYVKLITELLCFSRFRFRSGRIGTMFRESWASRSGGDISPRINNRQT